MPPTLAYVGTIPCGAVRVPITTECAECDSPAALGRLSCWGDPLCASCAAIDEKLRTTCGHCGYTGDDCEYSREASEFLCEDCARPDDTSSHEMMRRDFERRESRYRSPSS